MKFENLPSCKETALRGYPFDDLSSNWFFGLILEWILKTHLDDDDFVKKLNIFAQENDSWLSEQEQEQELICVAMQYYSYFDQTKKIYISLHDIYVYMCESILTYTCFCIKIMVSWILLYRMGTPFS